MHRRSFLGGVGFTLLANGLGRLPTFAWAKEDAGVADLSALLETLRAKQGLPGIAAAAVRGDRLVAEGVAGVRRIGTDDKITLDDRFSIASCTKRMTGLMVCRVIDTGKLAFDTALEEALPGVKMRDDYRRVTVAQLLDFTGGIQPYTMIRGPGGWAEGLRGLSGTPAQQREQFARRLLQEEPVVKPGTQKRYSNASYALAAFVASRRTRRTWEALMEEEVFKPLGMVRAGFGRPRSQERAHEPWRHFKRGKGYVPEPDSEDLKVEALAAAGDVHCSIRDFAKFAAYELAAAQGKDRLLKPATAARWQKLTRGEAAADRPLQFFGGAPHISAGYAAWPSENLAVVVAVNGGSADCKGIIEAVKQSCHRSEK